MISLTRIDAGGGCGKGPGTAAQRQQPERHDGLALLVTQSGGLGTESRARACLESGQCHGVAAAVARASPGHSGPGHWKRIAIGKRVPVELLMSGPASTAPTVTVTGHGAASVPCIRVGPFRRPPGRHGA